jgi:mono/diheme cytochrome c family protein
MRTAWLVPLSILASCGDTSRTARQDTTSPIQFVRVSPEAAAHGGRLSRVLGCNGCHGEELTGEDWSEPGFGKLWTANLTRAVPAYADAQLEQVIRAGRQPGGRELWEMPSHLFTQLTRDDMAALIAYLRSQPPRGDVRPPPVFEEGARREIAAGTFISSAASVEREGQSWPPGAGPQHRLARYIVRSTCAECHGMNLEGGQPNPQATPRPDLRMVAAYERSDFHRLLRTGKAAGNREVSLMSEVARGRYRHLTDAEVEALYQYLRAVGQQR